MLAVSCANGVDGAAITAADQAPGSPTPTASSSAPAWSDCEAIRPGDDFVFGETLNCSQEDLHVERLSCKSGEYVHIIRRGGDAVEGIEGVTPRWLRAEPRDPRYGRTPFAFQNCLEHG